MTQYQRVETNITASALAVRRRICIICAPLLHATSVQPHAEEVQLSANFLFQVLWAHPMNDVYDNFLLSKFQMSSRGSPGYMPKKWDLGC